MNDRPLILIAGPTATGKSALAAALAERLSGTVINADSMQVYDGLRILTARPGPADETRIPHRLYGVLPPDQACSAGRWRALALAACEEAWAAGRVPVVVGGTGLYLRALTQGLSPIPDIPPEVRAAARARFAEIGNTAFHVELAARDPVMAARLLPANSQRVVRAWEVIEATGRSLAAWQEMPGDKLDAATFTLALTPPGPELYAACDGRFLAMLDQGALAEAADFLARGLDPALPAMKTLGLRELGAYIAGQIPLAQASTEAQTATRHYAKRQLTWFRHQLTPDLQIDAKFSESLLTRIFSKIERVLLTPQ